MTWTRGQSSAPPPKNFMGVNRIDMHRKARFSPGTVDVKRPNLINANDNFALVACNDNNAEVATLAA